MQERQRLDDELAEKERLLQEREQELQRLQKVRLVCSFPDQACKTAHNLTTRHHMHVEWGQGSASVAEAWAA